MCLCHRWRKIRRFLKNRVRTTQRKVLIICPVLLESYSIAGFHRHHNEHKNYVIVSSDESHCLLTSIHNKEGWNEREGALINKLCDGQWDKTTLTDSNPCFHSSSFSMIIFIQSQPFFNDIMSMGAESDGSYDRFIFTVEKKLKFTYLHSNDRPSKPLNRTMHMISSSNFTPICLKSTSPRKLPTTSHGMSRLTKMLFLVSKLGISAPGTEQTMVSIIWPFLYNYTWNIFVRAYGS